MANNATNKIKRKTFGLVLKDGVEVKTLEDLRENFDLEKAIEYFKSGELLEWLEDRFYDDEAEKIENISPNDKNLSQKLCVALDVECDEDVEFIQRVREKKKILAEKTDDENIIDNATTTALNQDDLANLLHLDYSTIYLCGESFTVPIRVANKKYIGVLSTPKIKIRANSDEELATKNIVFENCKLAWRKEASIEEFRALAQKIFGNDGRFPIVTNGKRVSTFDQLDKVEKSAVLRMICQGKYAEHQIAFLQVTNDLSSGFAMTIDSFCIGGGIGSKIFPYKNMKLSFSKEGSPSWSYVLNVNGTSFASWYGYANDSEACKKLFGEHDSNFYEKVRNFLNVAKNF